jgi:hypothetical protein
MAIWTTDSHLNHDVYTVVYLLKHALRSSLEDAIFFARTSCLKPDVRGAGHAEIAARLGRFRSACNVLMEREALMLTKLLRARIWASELRKLVPEIQEEIDQFLDTTEQCRHLQAQFTRDAQRMFHGGGSLSRFLALRQSADAPKAARNYRVGGNSAIYELKAACEVFLAQINEEFFNAGHESANLSSNITPVYSYLDAAEEQTQLAVSQRPPLH